MTTNLLQDAIDRGFKCAPDSLFHAVITEVQQDGKGIAWNFESDLSIRPYPNELKYGGGWQNYTTGDPAEKEYLEKHYEQEAKLCRELGMTDVSIETKVVQCKIKPRQEVLL